MLSSQTTPLHGRKLHVFSPGSAAIYPLWTSIIYLFLFFFVIHQKEKTKNSALSKNPCPKPK
jgi:hypothetical protein